MRKILTFLLMLAFLISCSTTQEAIVEEDVVDRDDEVVNFSIREEVGAPYSGLEEPEAEAIQPVVVEEAVPVESVVEEEVETPAPIQQETEEEKKDISPLSIVEEISGRILEPEKVEAIEEEVSPPDTETAIEEETTEEAEEDTSLPSPEIVESDGLEEAADQIAGSRSVLDNELSDEILYVMIELIVIVFLFTISSVIRNKSRHPLPVFVSLLLALLFTAIPVISSMVFSGWSNLLLIYLVILLSFGIFRSKDKRF